MKNNTKINLHNRIISYLPDRFIIYASMIRYDRPIGFQLLFWPCVIAMGVALSEYKNKNLDFSIFQFFITVLLFYVGSILMRGFGCIVNDLIDKDLDKHVKRTQDRPISSGNVTHFEIGLITLILSIVSLAILLSFNVLTIYIGFLSIPFILIYPLMKRVTWYPQAMLGIVFNWGAFIGYTALTNTITIIPFILHFALFFWTVGYDTIYALQDIEDDIKIGIYSTARRFSHKIRYFVALCYSITIIILSVLMYYLYNDNILPFMFLMLTAIHLGWQVYTLNKDNPSQNLKLFRSNHSAGFLMALAFCIPYFI